MSQVVQARCPHCQNVLRIPAEWIAKPMRCKNCRQVFQAKAPAALPSAIPIGKSPEAIRSATPASGAPFSFAGGGGVGSPLVRPPIRRQRNWWKTLAALVVLAGVGTAVGIVSAPHIAEMFAAKNEPPRDTPPADGLASTDTFKKPDEKKPGADKKTPEDNTDKSKNIDKAVQAPTDKSTQDKTVRPPEKVIVDKLMNWDKFGPDKTEKKIDKKVEEPRKIEEPKKVVKPPPPIDKKKVVPPPPPDKDKTVIVKKETPKPPDTEVYPRRALLISVNDYVFANALNYGVGGAPPPKKGAFMPGNAGSTRVLKDLLSKRPMSIPPNQVAEMTDGPPTTVMPIKQNIENAVVDLVSTARTQDRVILFFAGHVTDIEKDSFLVPLEGEMGDIRTLIPLKWVYSQLAKCKAQEKVLILDVCRFSPGRGFDLPGGGEAGTGAMTEDLDTRLQQPPPGVQVWVSCVKGQHSVEHEDRGSVFLQALCAALREGPFGVAEANYPFPLETLVPAVNQRIKDMNGKIEQVSRLTGEKGKEGLYDPREAAPPGLVLKNVVVAGAEQATVEAFVDEIRRIHPARKGRIMPRYMPPLPAPILDLYKWDHEKFPPNIDAAKQPVRDAVVQAIGLIDKHYNIPFPEVLRGGAGPVDKKTKEAFFRNQQGPGQSIFELETFLPKLLAVGEKLEEEPSKYWQAQYQYTLARFQSRLVYLYEYNFIMAQVRGDQLPDLNPDMHQGWRVASRAKVQVSESKVKDMVKVIGKLWKNIIEQYPDTPWAVFAKRERMFALGLEWKPWPK